MGHNPYRHYLLRLAVIGGVFGFLTLLFFLFTDLPQPYIWSGIVTMMGWRMLGRRMI
ncbi:hypothetical protein [Paenibacillus phytohabitans]|uniref:hypothetical protein n=1 Tax=Paenibacillus phytohabitans TaxID=2654978 RepID=UPI0014912355|nr:hypothetical protein [Paenibacillus phytohabitans]